jgi:cysteine desulfurase
MTTRSIYLDYNATTPLDQGVLDDMLPWMTEQFWNAASTHPLGRRAATATDSAREEIAAFVGVEPREIVFMSGATEADNAALKGAYAAGTPNRKRIIIGATEHKAVLDTAGWLADQGVEVAIAPVDDSGRIIEGAFRKLLDETVGLVSIMLANNETGVLAPIAHLADATHEVGAIFHTDATQAVGRIPVDFAALGVDLASFSAHKMYGPKGVGALFVSRRTDIDPLIHGGGHERGIRSGTLNVPGIIGFARATQLASRSLSTEPARQARLVEHLVNGLSECLQGVELVGETADRLPNTANIRFSGADAEAVMANAPDLAVSSGSACTSMIPAPSHVLSAMGLDSDAALECLRFSVGRPTVAIDIDEATESVVNAVHRVRDLQGAEVR